MGMLCVDFKNSYASDHQWLRTPDKNAFVFTVAGVFPSIPEYSEKSRIKK